MLDNTDINILKELSNNSRIKMKELGKRVHLSGQATANRVAKLEENGVIEAYTIKINQEKLGYPVHVIINITSTKSYNHQAYINFINSQEDYILHNYKISGEGCYILECRFPSNEALDKFLIEVNKYVNYKITVILKDTIKKE